RCIQHSFPGMSEPADPAGKHSEAPVKNQGKGNGKRRSQKNSGKGSTSSWRAVNRDQEGASSANWRAVNRDPEGASSTNWRAVNRDPEGASSATTADAQQSPQDGDRRWAPGKGAKNGKGKGKSRNKHKAGETKDARVSSVQEDTHIVESRQVPESASVAERLAQQLSRGSYDCMICLGKVKPSNPIWSCTQCWAAFHLKCIKSWVRRCNSAGGLEFNWACPGCRYNWVDRMPEYTCYCKKVPEPELNPHWLAHSCGEVCERNRGCPHPCPELCHPGPCPRCTAVGGPGSCHCGRERTETSRCGDPRQWSCGSTCGRALSCGHHFCKARCHTGPCPPCAETSLESCFCGKNQEQRLCGHVNFSCHKPCGSRLECEEHYCERECHPGDCGLCLRDPGRWGDRCACGKITNCSHESARSRLLRFVGERRRCAQPLALCKQICGKRHERCSHTCEKLCHEGPCGQCATKVQRNCRCVRTKREVVCSEVDDVLCHQVCRTKKTCGNHKCEAVCCEGFNDRNHEAHICLQVCGRPLSCGNHTCEDFCHLGNCPPCRVVLHEAVFCACGKNSIEPPVVCGTEPPQCDEPCAQPMECGHTCPAKCHQGDHPLCYEPVDRPCIGGHTQMKNVPCHVGPMSCGQACGKQLPCGHSCSSQCHSGDCKACTKPCGARRVHCSHNCQAPCHAGSQCEDAPCRCKVKQACPCGQRVEERSCGAFSGLPRPQFAAPRCLASCERPSLQLPEGEVVKYTADLLQLAMHNRRYVQMLEDTFAALMSKGRAEAPGRTPQVPSMQAVGTAWSPWLAILNHWASNAQALPPCDASRRLLAIEYARLHWRFKTATKSDVAEGWWQVQVAPASSSRVPRPLLSEIAGASSMSAVSSHLLPALSSQPCLRFAGLKSVDEVYDLVGLEGLLGVRPGDAGEAIAFLERGALGAAIFKKLTSQEPGQEFISVRGQSAWGQPGASASRPRVKLEQTLTSGPRAPRPKPQLDAWESKEEAVPENWEDM
ncbi:unnamed protein product, partial [Effrenium voratum]